MDVLFRDRNHDEKKDEHKRLGTTHFTYSLYSKNQVVFYSYMNIIKHARVILTVPQILQFCTVTKRVDEVL